LVSIPVGHQNTYYGSSKICKPALQLFNAKSRVQLFKRQKLHSCEGETFQRQKLKSCEGETFQTAKVATA